MPRRPQLLVTGIPIHITQRDLNRGATFIDAEDHLFYKRACSRLAEARGEKGDEARVHCEAAEESSRDFPSRTLIAQAVHRVVDTLALSMESTSETSTHVLTTLTRCHGHCRARRTRV